MNERIKKRRRSLRLPQYDYAQPGAYFITICTQNRVCLFGDAVAGVVHLNSAGQLAATMWHDLPARFAGIEMDAFVVMPNHLHGLIVLKDAQTANTPGAAATAAPTIGAVVGAFKSSFTVAYLRGREKAQWPAVARRFLQRNYYEHIIRNEAELARVRRYIEENPARWEFDRENPQAMP